MPKMESTSLAWIVTLGLASTTWGGVISNVVETGGDNEFTDTITAKWTGQTYQITVANEPLPGSVVGSNFTVGNFGHLAPAYVDRLHRFVNDPSSAIPVYLNGNEYIMSGTDNRDNAGYRLDVTLAGPAILYLLIDNRLGDGDTGNPPAFSASHMQWVLDQGWLPTSNGLNRNQSSALPDEVAMDEGADGTTNQWFSVYRKTFAAGTYQLFQADNPGQSMYSVVVDEIETGVPEPETWLLALSGGLAFLACRRINPNHKSRV